MQAMECNIGQMVLRNTSLFVFLSHFSFKDNKRRICRVRILLLSPSFTRAFKFKYSRDHTLLLQIHNCFNTM